MIVLLGACGLERLAEPLRRHTGAEVTVSAWNDLALLARLPTPPALVYVDLLEWSAAMPFVSAHLRGLPPPPPDPARTAVVAALQATGLPVVYRGSREPLAAGLAAALLAGARVLDVRALWAQHGILSDGVRHGPGHGEAELGPLGTSRRTGQTAAEVEAEALYGLWYGRVHGARKCVAVDLDHTLIYGLLADDSFALRNPGWDPEARSPAEAAWWQAPRGIHTALRALQRRGILLALVTRNDPALVAARLRRRPGADPALSLLLDVGDFVAIEAGFGSKSDALRRLAAGLGLGLEALLFVDDSPTERAEVRQNVPEVAVLEGTPLEFGERLLAHPALVPWEVDPETAARRADSYRSRAAVVQARPEALAEFLHGLRLEVAVRPATAADLGRVRELLARSHQLTLNGQRPQPATPEGVWVALARDRLADHGLVAAGVLAEGRWVAWACSCRVLPHQLAPSILWAMRQAAGGGTAVWEATGRNGAARCLVEESAAGLAPWVRLLSEG